MSAYRRGRSNVIISSVQAGPLFSAPPVFVVPDTEDDHTLGAAVRQAAEAARLYEGPYDDFGLPSDLGVRDEWEREVLESVGVKNWQTLERGAKLVSVTWGPDEVSMTPMRRHRAGGWMREKTDDDLPVMQVVRVSTSATDTEIGAALRRALAGPTPTD